MKNKKKILVYGLLLANLLVILVGWLMGSQRSFVWDLNKILLVSGRLAGLLAVYAILLQFVLIGREIWVEKLFGFDRLAKLHRYNGYFSMGFLFIHAICINLAYALPAGISMNAQSLDFWNNFPLVNLAMIAMILFVLVVFSSITIAKKRLKYELWYGVHLLTYLAVILGFGHQLAVGGDFKFKNVWFAYYWWALYGVVLGSFVWFRFILPLVNFWRFGFVVDKVVEETSDSWSIYIRAKKANLQKMGAQPGQFMSFRFLAKGFWLENHPFSLSMVPKENMLRITVKKLGDYTAKIGQLPVRTPVLIEGPFGLFTAQPGQNNHYVFIAGGVGITPIRALVEQVAADNQVVVYYANRSYKDIILRQEMEDLAATHKFKLIHILSDAPAEGCESGRLDKEKLLRFTPDLKNSQVYMCGPGPMTAAIEKTLLTDFGLKKEQIHFDIFSY